MVIFFLFLFGFVWGSFLNVVIFRWTSEESVIWHRSHCRSCGKVLKWHELLPVVSFLIQAGKCRNCASKISWQYPIVELLGGLIALVSLGQLEIGNSAFTPVIYSFWLFLLLSSLLVLFFIDLREKFLPIGIVILGVVSTLIWRLLLNYSNGDFSDLLSVALTALGSYAFFFALWFFSRGAWMGLGDANLAALLGLALGWPKTLLAFLFAFWLGALVGLVLVLLKIRGLKDEVPFGPFLIVPAVYFLFFPVPPIFSLFYPF